MGLRAWEGKHPALTRTSEVRVLGNPRRTGARSSTDKSTRLRPWVLGVQISPGALIVRWRNGKRGGPLLRDGVGSTPTLTADRGRAFVDGRRASLKSRAGATGSTARPERADRGSNPWP